MLKSARPNSKSCYIFQMRWHNLKEHLTIKVAVPVLGKKKKIHNLRDPQTIKEHIAIPLFQMNK